MAEHELYTYKGYKIYLVETIYNNKEIKVEYKAKNTDGEIGPKESIQLLRDAVDRQTKESFDRISIIAEERYGDEYEKSEVTSYNRDENEYWTMNNKKQREKHRCHHKSDCPIKDTPENWDIINEIKNQRKIIKECNDKITELRKSFEKVILPGVSDEDTD